MGFANTPHDSQGCVYCVVFPNPRRTRIITNATCCLLARRCRLVGVVFFDLRFQVLFFPLVVVVVVAVDLRTQLRSACGTIQSTTTTTMRRQNTSIIHRRPSPTSPCRTQRQHPLLDHTARLHATVLWTRIWCIATNSVI